MTLIAIAAIATIATVATTDNTTTNNTTVETKYEAIERLYEDGTDCAEIASLINDVFGTSYNADDIGAIADAKHYSRLAPVNNLYAQNYTVLYTNKNETHIQDQLGFEFVLNNVDIDDGSEIVVTFDNNGTIDTVEDDTIVSWNYSEFNF